MPRTSQLLREQRQIAPARPAATILLLRDTELGLEVLMTRRSPNARFAPNAYVFPGGGVDEADSSVETVAVATRRADQDDERLTYAIAAIRESFEEVGVLLARHADGRLVTSADIDKLDRLSRLPEQCSQSGLMLAADTVFPFARWTADLTLPQRYDVPFVVARMPPDQTAVADDKEQFEAEWVRPDDALARHADGKFSMIFPTMRTLQKLAKFKSVDEVMAACSSQVHLWESTPRAGLKGGKESRHMEEDLPYGELALVSPDGQIFHPLDWQTEAPVSLLKNVRRLTAPNAGVMTGPGTNTYIVGDRESGFIVIDPGPNDAAHIARIVDATEGDVRAIVCTHSHPDHSPGAPTLKNLCATNPLIYGIASKPTSRVDSQFTPDVELANGQDVEVRRFEESLPITHTLRCIYTPGHAANHLCLVLVEDNILFSGDHILNGSTTVISMPDGNMNDYLNSLDLLLAACDEYDIDFILPAHGYAMNAARKVITHLKEHRLKREAKVIAAMRAKPAGSVEDWVAIAYSDTPERLWPIAAHSLRAHQQRIELLGLV